LWKQLIKSTIAACQKWHNKMCAELQNRRAG
jgi:hypothetical protein